MYKIRRPLAIISNFVILLSSILVFLFMNTTTVSATYEEAPVYKYTYNLLGEDEMPIMMFSGPISDYVYYGKKYDSLMTDDVFSMLKDCGVNTIIGCENGVENDFTDITTTLNLADRYNINYITFDTHLVCITGLNNTIGQATSQDVKERIEFYKSHPSFAGLFLIDEPNILKNEKIKQGQDFVEENFADCEKEKIGYVNMLPITKSFNLYSGKEDVAITYEELLDSYMAEVKPKFLSYDKYPFLTDEKVYPFKTTKVGEEWFDNIAIIRYYAEKYHVPFMGHIQVGGQWEGIGNSLPNEHEFMWNINTLLAYGCKGISYFTGVQSTYHMTNQFGYEGLIALDGQKTRYWYYADTMYDQIKQIDDILMNSANLGIMAVGTTPDLINSKYQGKEVITIYENFRELKSVESESALIGCFDYKGKTVLYVVNNSFESEGETTLNFDKKYNIGVVQQGTVRNTKSKKLKLTLAGGEGALIMLR